MTRETLARLYWHAAALNRECKASTYEPSDIRDLKFAADKIAACNWPTLQRAASVSLPIVVVHDFHNGGSVA